jgi:DNA-directed RNA polymerase specialized sigma subunit
MASREELIEDLQDLADELGKTPTKREMEEYGEWSSWPYRRAFGSWNYGLKEAKLAVNLEQNSYDYSPNKLITNLQDIADKLGKTPSRREIDEHGEWPSSVYENTFDSWNSALQEAGLSINQKDNISNEELLSSLQDLADELGKTPSSQEMEDQGKWSEPTYRNAFGSWNSALREAGLEPVVEKPVEHEWDDSIDDYYGESWAEMRQKTVQRDNEQCRVCGDDEIVNVHHIKPRRLFANPDDSNTLDNLVTLCRSCHGTFENRWTECSPDEFVDRAKNSLRSQS